MSKFKGDDFQFPDEVEDKVEAVEDELQVEIEDDTPPEDRGRRGRSPAARSRSRD